MSALGLPGVLLLFHLQERFETQGLDAAENQIKPCPWQSVEEFRVLNKIHTRFGRQGRGIVMGLLPLRQIRQQPQSVAPIPDKIVVHQEYGASPAEIVEQLKLTDHLFIGFGPRDTTKELGN